MTTATTDADRRRRRPWLLYLLGFSVLVHVVGLLALRPYIRTEMLFNLAQQEQREEEVRQRELQRQERERQRRQEIPLSEQQAEALQREVELAHRREIADRVRELMEIREHLEEVRQQSFEQLARRLAEKREPATFAQLDEQVRTLGDQVSAAEPDLTVQAQMDAVEQQHAAVEAVTDPPTEPRDPAMPLGDSATAAALEMLAQRADELGQTLAERLPGEAGPQARRVSQTSRELAEAGGREKRAIAQQASAPPPISPIPPVTELAESPPDELYDQAVELEQSIDDAHDDLRAAELAMNRDTTFAEARDALSTWRPDRPDLGQQLRDGAPAQTVGSLNAMREMLDQATSEVNSMAIRGRNSLASAQGAVQQTPGVNRFAQQAMLRQAAAQRGQNGLVVDLTQILSLNPGAGTVGGDSTHMSADFSGEGSNMAPGSADGQRVQLSEGKILATAMPGRMFTEQSARAGWLYIDTWYVIGPWENRGKVEFEKVHPPEVEMDFDAQYHDGKFADRPGHPDQMLRWEFIQADHIRVEPPRVYGASTYYAYTELYFDTDRDMLISVASDDAAKMWLNGQEIWADYGLSPWRLGEGFRRVPFRKGFNTLLVRIENGPGHCIWSVLLCPPEVMN